MTIKDPLHPGRSIRENCLYPLGLNGTDAARVLNGHSVISPEMAIQLEKTGWSNAGFWLLRQTTYDLVQARRHGSSSNDTSRPGRVSNDHGLLCPNFIRIR